ncbi:MAG TPA: flavodoxin [Steroidobacteraceae bacterium]|nr:flavodoxin [Steroidobacteraceae bacterium]
MDQKRTQKRVLIAYYSLTGNTARVARDLASRLGADVESVKDRKHGVGFLGQLAAAIDARRGATAPIDPIQYDPADYPFVIVGTPVWMWRMTPAIRAYLQTTRSRLSDVAFFVTSGDTNIAKIAPALEAVLGKHSLAAAGFSARELADPTTYEHKLSAFVAAIQHHVNRTPAAA